MHELLSPTVKHAWLSKAAKPKHQDKDTKRASQQALYL